MKSSVEHVKPGGTMPPYFSVHYSFPYDYFSSNFTKNVYETIFEFFPFKSGYWESKNNSLEEIISWNSKLLSKKFKLGLNQHVKNDYKQMLLHSDQYSHLRLFWIYHSNEITLHLILPEDEVELNDNTWRFDGSQLAPLLQLSIRLWNKHRVNTVQTYRELGAPVNLRRILKGELASTDPFSIIGSEPFEKLERLESKYKTIMIDKGALIIEQDYASLFNEDTG
ncbi:MULTISPECIES: hypothetical protein [Paenibacillus]|nr:hypothetical protein [Paenibacillus lactis]MBP1893493.1 hypothetical protein [Paenibacillus lactis]